MDTLNEKRVHGNISLSHTQKYVLAKLISSPTPLTAYESVSNGRNIVAARDQLTGLGLMRYDEGEAVITDAGMEAMREENLVDEMGNLTDEGEQYGYASGPEEVEKLAAQNKQPEPPANPAEPAKGNRPAGSEATPNPFGGAPAMQGAAEPSGTDMSLESLELISEIDGILKEQAFLKKIKKS
jgi:hypothetical protein